jgi:hypothetical protein
MDELELIGPGSSSRAWASIVPEAVKQGGGRSAVGSDDPRQKGRQLREHLGDGG